MQVRYFVHHNGTRVGPLSFQEIETQLNGNRLFPTDYVYVGEKGDWIPMLEFILVHGPKEKVMQPALQTQGSRSPGDDELDWKRFVSGIPAALGPRRDASQEFHAYPVMPAGAQDAVTELMHEQEAPQIPATPPPPKPPRAVRERKVLEETLRKRSQPPPARSAPNAKPSAIPKPPPPSKPGLRAAPRPAPRIDASAVAHVEVLPAQATRLTIQITGNARVGDELEILVVAQTENGDVDVSFNDTVEIACDRPLGGLAPLQFINGTARLNVRCLTQGTHQFSLVLNNSAPVNLARTDISQVENQTGMVH